MTEWHSQMKKTKMKSSSSIYCDLMHADHDYLTVLLYSF